MTKFLPAICWAAMMMMFALLARFGLADRSAVTTMLMIMPLLAFVSLRRGRDCRAVSRES